MNPKRIPILCYHRVCPANEIGPDSRSLCVTPQQFEKQMAFLKFMKITPITIPNLIAYLKNQKNIPQRSIVLTFDDGYQDNYRYAFPILKRYGYNATIFLVTDQIGKTNSWDSGVQPMLTQEQIDEMVVNGVSFGSHSATHIDISKSDENKIKSELEKSRMMLESILSRKDISFCYPYARLNSEAKDYVKNAGYVCGIAGDTGPDDQFKDLYELKRVQVFPSTNLFGFWKKIQPWYPSWMRLQKKLKGESA